MREQPNMIPIDNEIDLVKKAQKGDREAFGELYDKYAGRIKGYLYRYTGNYHKAEEIMLETFISAYEHMKGYKEMGKFSSWLFRIATNYVKKYFASRERKNISLSESDDGDDGSSMEDKISDESNMPDRELRAENMRACIQSLLAEIGERYRDVLVLVDMEGLSYREAAKVLKTQPETVKTRLRRARAMMYEKIKKKGYEF